MSPTRANAYRYYQVSKASAAATDASPHQLISMLFDGVLDRMGIAVGQIASGDLVGKVRTINSAMEIVAYLRAILDVKAGGDLALRLDALYDYMLRRLVHANGTNDPEALREVSRLVGTIKSGWEQIPESLRGG